MNKQLSTIAAALALACLSSTASADEVRVFATASFGDNESGFGSAEYGWGSGNNIFTIGTSLLVVKVPKRDDPEKTKAEFNIGLNGGYTYLFNPEGNTGFVEGRAGTFDVSKFSDSAFYEVSVGYRWYLSDRAALGWNIIGYEQRQTAQENNSPSTETEYDWEGSPFTRLQLIVALD
ncbi:MAG: hypothetical protein DYH17_07440 [Xanthomonadales bacterium PRO6]|nr:hypothetical protein [Xanthomonadales bacterium]MCE7931193.1 hypothetical protein [Xanthomonadales bacterium PRO6]